MMKLSIFLLVLFALSGAWITWQIRRRGLDRWLGEYVRQSRRRRSVRHIEEIHMLLCVADHFEPRWGNVSDEVAASRVRQWVEQYPRLFGRFHDADGRPPRHTFFYPIDQYEAGPVDALAE